MIVGVKYEGGCLNRNKGCSEGCVEIGKKLKIEFPKINNFNCDKSLEQIEDLKGKVFIGGDHSISYSLVKGFKRKHKTFGLIIFDAHADCCEPFKTATHEDWLRKLIQEKIIKKENVLLIGVRDVDKTEVEFLKNMEIIKCEDLLNNLEIINFVNRFKNVYLSLDIDVVDARDAPGTGCKVKKGIRKELFLKIIKELSRFKNIKRVDLVEVNPKLDIENKTVKLAVEIIKIFLKGDFK